MASDTAGPGIASAAAARELLTGLYRAGVEAADPGRALRAALEGLPAPAAASKVWLIALGKAAHPMSRAAIDFLAGQGRTPAGGVIVAPHPGPSAVPARGTEATGRPGDPDSGPDSGVRTAGVGGPGDGDSSPTVASQPISGLEVVVGDHPAPGEGSLAAAEAIGRVAAEVKEGDEVWVLLSGGATSLAAAPVPGIPVEDLWALYRLLLSSGLDIVEMNSVRKRFSRWGAGRLGTALYPARVRVFVVSDVVGDDLGSIGSGPCVADPATAAGVRRLVERAGLWEAMPQSARRLLERVAADPRLETPKPGTEELSRIESTIVAGNRLALEAVVRRAREAGLEPLEWPEPLTGEASEAGRRLARVLLERPAGTPVCLIAGGETVVTIPSDQLRDQPAPVPDQPAPAPDQAAPAPDQAAPVPDQPAPAPDQAAPVPDQAAPAPDQAAPVPDQAAPVPERADPAPERADPAPDQPAPDEASGGRQGAATAKDPNTPGAGGRCQELALAAAEVLAGSGAMLLAAGTDGRDGPTDAAGAFADGSTWEAVAKAGRNPKADLAGHNSHPALGSAGALLTTGPTGTNVMDLVIGLGDAAIGADSGHRVRLG